MFTDACIAISSSSDTDGQGQFPDADEKFSKTPYFNFNDGKVKFDTNDVDNANENYGSASGLLPKFLLPTNRHPYGCLFACCPLDRIQPPSMRPISSISS